MSSSTTHSQPTISSYFQSSPQKRPNSYIDLTLEGDDNDLSGVSTPGPPPSKRVRLTRTTSDSPTGKPAPSPVKTTSATAEDWRFSPEKAKARQGNHRHLSAAERERHEAFKRKLLLDNSLFLMRKEAEEVIQLDPGDGGDESCGGDQDGRFEKLSEMFAHKSQVKGKVIDKKGKSSTRLKKKGVELGSSGEPYTPLEKQVCCCWLQVSPFAIFFITDISCIA